MKKYKATGLKEQYITFGGIEYAFLVGRKRIGIRRMDQKNPSKNAVEKLTEYIKAEGWADHLIEKEEEDF